MAANIAHADRDEARRHWSDFKSRNPSYDLAALGLIRDDDLAYNAGAVGILSQALKDTAPDSREKAVTRLKELRDTYYSRGRATPYNVNILTPKDHEALKTATGRLTEKGRDSEILDAKQTPLQGGGATVEIYFRNLSARVLFEAAYRGREAEAALALKAQADVLFDQEEELRRTVRGRELEVSGLEERDDLASGVLRDRQRIVKELPQELRKLLRRKAESVVKPEEKTRWKSSLAAYLATPDGLLDLERFMAAYGEYQKISGDGERVEEYERRGGGLWFEVIYQDPKRARELAKEVAEIEFFVKEENVADVKPANAAPVQAPTPAPNSVTPPTSQRPNVEKRGKIYKTNLSDKELKAIGITNYTRSRRGEIVVLADADATLLDFYNSRGFFQKRSLRKDPETLKRAADAKKADGKIYNVSERELRGLGLEKPKTPYIRVGGNIITSDPSAIAVLDAYAERGFFEKLATEVRGKPKQNSAEPLKAPAPAASPPPQSGKGK